jgi:hypothetical protein
MRSRGAAYVCLRRRTRPSKLSAGRRGVAAPPFQDFGTIFNRDIPQPCWNAALAADVVLAAAMLIG